MNVSNTSNAANSAANAAGLRTLKDMNTTARPNSDTELGSDDFLKLLTTQLQNQDPLSPMQNEQFLAQLAQMSSVNGIETLNKTMTNVAHAMTNSMISGASSMLGQRALVTGSTARAHQGSVDGRVNVPANGSQVSVTYKDASNGQILHTEVMRDQRAGTKEFSWKGAPTDGRKINVSATITDQSGTKDASVQVYALIEGVEVNPKTNAMVLRVQDYGQHKGSDITALR